MNFYINWQRSKNSILKKWSTMTLSHKISHVMEMPKIEFSYKTQTQNKNDIYSQRKNNIWLTKSPLYQRKWILRRKCQNNSLWRRRKKKDSRRKLGRKFRRNSFWVYVTRNPRTKWRNRTGILYNLLPDALNYGINTVLWPKCLETGTEIEIIMVNPYEEICAYKKFYGQMKY